jgi:hypothetical protein
MKDEEMNHKGTKDTEEEGRRKLPQSLISNP